MADSLKLWWAWKNRVDRPILRSSFIFSTAVLFSTAALLVAIFSNYVVSTSDIEILVDSPSCRYLNLTAYYSGDHPHWASFDRAVESYVDNCYGNSSTMPEVCRNTFTRPTLRSTKEPAACPWNSTMCLEGEKPAVAMDTGLLNVNEWLGINLPKKDTVRFRKRTTCNPIPIANHAIVRPFADVANVTVSDPPHLGEEVFCLQLGPLPIPSDEFPEYTFIQDLAKANYTKVFSGDSVSKGDFEPLPEMNRTDADVVIDVIWMNNVRYDVPVNDPIFAGHRAMNFTHNGKVHTSYHVDNPVGIIGCTQQYQFCLEDEQSCTPLSGLSYPLQEQDFPAASELQLEVLRLALVLLNVNDISNGPKLGLYQANDLIVNTNTRELADDQWVNEITFWNALALAGTQIMLSDTAVGFNRIDPVADSYTDAPVTASQKTLCKSMKMRKAGGFANINVFGLAFIITFSVVVTVLNLTILRFVLFLSKFRRALAPRIDRWAQDGIFQLQRRAFDAHGEGSWIDLEKEIPVTGDKSKLAQLPVESLPTAIDEKWLARVKTWRTDLTAVTMDEKEHSMPVPPYGSEKKISSEGNEIRSVEEEEERCYVPQEVLEERATRNENR